MNSYALLRKQKIPMPNEDDMLILQELPNKELLDSMSKQPIAFDFETHSIDPTKGSIRSIAISNDYGTVAIDLEALSKQDRLTLTRWLVKQELIAHNMVFDASWIYAKLGVMPKMEACTLLLYKLITTEGFVGQRWGLKYAMINVLGWDESNEVDLYDWLKANKLKAQDMAQAPWEILGKYNALDAAATWQLYKVFMDVIEKNDWQKNIYEFQKEDFCNLVKLAIEQQVKGMTIDLKALTSYGEDLDNEIENKRQEFLTHSEVKEHVEYYQKLIVDEIQKTEPPQFTKTGKVTARYLKWVEKLKSAKTRIDFNIDSPSQLRWLFYERLFYECPITTEKGVYSVGKKAFPHLGKLGKLMKDYRALRDKRKFITSLHAVQVDGVLHPSIKMSGTLTGRSSGGVIED